MVANTVNPDRIRAAWQGRISGCMLGKPVEVLSFQQGRSGLEGYLSQAQALPLRDYVPLIEGSIVDRLGRNCCRDHIDRAEPDDDINYTVMALLLLEDKAGGFSPRPLTQLINCTITMRNYRSMTSLLEPSKSLSPCS